MPANRFYFNGPLNQTKTIQIQGAEHHHLSRVMRVAMGEEVEVMDGRGALALAQVMQIQKESTTLQILQLAISEPLATKMISVIPFMRPNKLEWTLEKAIELGADGFKFYRADYSEKEQITTTQLERLHNLSIAAMKQSGRLFFPSMEILPSLKQALSTDSALIFGDTRPAAQNILTIPLANTFCCVTGPERGFSEEELQQLHLVGTGVTLGPYILRAETAPLVALSVLSLRALAVSKEV